MSLVDYLAGLFELIPNRLRRLTYVAPAQMTDPVNLRTLPRFRRDQLATPEQPLPTEPGATSREAHSPETSLVIGRRLRRLCHQVGAARLAVAPVARDHSATLFAQPIDFNNRGNGAIRTSIKGWLASLLNQPHASTPLSPPPARARSRIRTRLSSWGCEAVSHPGRLRSSPVPGPWPRDSVYSRALR